MKILRGKKEERIIRALKERRVVVLPTDTVYGLFCRAFCEDSVARIFRIKKRSRDKVLGIFVRGPEEAEEYARLGEEQKNRLEQYWPGKVTFVLEKKREFPPGVGTEETIGLRAPDYPLFLSLLRKIEFPLVQTSANLSGKPSPLDSEEVIREFKDRALGPDLVLDAGGLPKAEPSTVVDLTSTPPRVLRRGEVEF